MRAKLWLEDALPADLAQATKVHKEIVADLLWILDLPLGRVKIMYLMVLPDTLPPLATASRRLLAEPQTEVLFDILPSADTATGLADTRDPVVLYEELHTQTGIADSRFRTMTGPLASYVPGSLLRLCDTPSSSSSPEPSFQRTCKRPQPIQLRAKQQMDSGAVAGITIGILIAVVIVVVILCCLCKNKDTKDSFKDKDKDKDLEGNAPLNGDYGGYGNGGGGDEPPLAANYADLHNDGMPSTWDPRDRAVTEDTVVNHDGDLPPNRMSGLEGVSDKTQPNNYPTMLELGGTMEPPLDLNSTLMSAKLAGTLPSALSQAPQTAVRASVNTLEYAHEEEPATYHLQYARPGSPPQHNSERTLVFDVPQSNGVQIESQSQGPPPLPAGHNQNTLSLSMGTLEGLTLPFENGSDSRRYPSLPRAQVTNGVGEDEEAVITYQQQTPAGGGEGQEQQYNTWKPPTPPESPDTTTPTTPQEHRQHSRAEELTGQAPPRTLTGSLKRAQVHPAQPPPLPQQGPPPLPSSPSPPPGRRPPPRPRPPARPTHPPARPPVGPPPLPNSNAFHSNSQPGRAGEADDVDVGSPYRSPGSGEPGASPQVRVHLNKPLS